MTANSTRMRKAQMKAVKPLPPTLSEQWGESTEPQRSAKERIPFWAREVLCPECGALMTLLKAKADQQWGDTMTYQCQARKPFVVMTLTTSVANFMRPGDFTSSTPGWRAVAPHTPDDVEAVPNTFSGVPVTPEVPWVRRTAMSTLYEQFWAIYPEPVDYADLLLRSIDIKGQAHAVKIRELIDELPEWMAHRTGYVVKLGTDAKFRVIGKTVGGTGVTALPFSNPEYKRVHGFPLEEESV